MKNTHMIRKEGAATPSFRSEFLNQFTKSSEQIENVKPETITKL